MELSGLLYLIIGFLVAAFSAYVNMRTNSIKMLLFVLVGIGMLIYGAWKLFRKEPKAAIHHPHQQYSGYDHQKGPVHKPSYHIRR